VQRLHSRLRAGATLTVDTWTGDAQSSSLDAHDPGAGLALGQVAVGRERDSLSVHRGLAGPESRCPSDAVCVDAHRALRTDLFAAVSDDGSFEIGAQTRIANARFAVRLRNTGPQLSMNLPLAHWLGVSRWVPLEARLRLGLDGVDALPRVRRKGYGRDHGDRASR
jgi:hypothetical protein